MADPIAYQQALIDAGTTCARAAETSLQAALATAGLVPPDQLPAGMPMPTKNLNDAATISSFANNAAEAAHHIAEALELLQRAPLKAPAGNIPDLYPTTP